MFIVYALIHGKPGSKLYRNYLKIFFYRFHIIMFIIMTRKNVNKKNTWCDINVNRDVLYSSLHTISADWHTIYSRRKIKYDAHSCFNYYKLHPFHFILVNKYIFFDGFVLSVF